MHLEDLDSLFDYPEVDLSDLLYADSVAELNLQHIETYREIMIRFINYERTKRGLNALIPRDDFMKEAQRHSVWMSKNKYQHSGNGMDEVITYGNGNYLQRVKHNAGLHVGQWMTSDAHRDALLDPNNKYIGTGFAFRSYVGRKNFYTEWEDYYTAIFD